MIAPPEPWLKEELQSFYRGRQKLAEMMGRDPETFTDQDVEVGSRKHST